MEQKEFKDLAEQLGKAVKDLNDAIAKSDAEVKANGAVTLETKGLVEKINTRIDELEVKMNRRVITPQSQTESEVKELSDSMKALDAALRFGTKGSDRMSAEVKAAFVAMRSKALSEGTDTQGGFTVPEDFQTQVIKKIANFSALGSLISRQPTSRDTLRWPVLPYSGDDISTSPVSVTWEDESESVSETDFSMGSAAIPVKKMRALIKVSNDLLEDSSVNIIGLIAELLGEAFGLEEDSVFTNGTGGKKPEGFMVSGSIGSVNSGHASNFTYDGIQDLTYGLPEQYAGQAVYMTRRTSVGALRKIKDLEGRPMWQPSLVAGQPATFNGYSLYTNERMPALGAAAKPLIFADFKRLYMAADRVGMTIRRLDEKYAETDQTGFIARRRVGGKVLQPWAAKTQLISA